MHGGRYFQNFEYFVNLYPFSFVLKSHGTHGFREILVQNLYCNSIGTKIEYGLYYENSENANLSKYSRAPTSSSTPPTSSSSSRASSPSSRKPTRTMPTLDVVPKARRLLRAWVWTHLIVLLTPAALPRQHSAPWDAEKRCARWRSC